MNEVIESVLSDETYTTNEERVEDSIPDVIKNNDIRVLVSYDDNTVEENTNKVLKCFNLNK